MRWRPNILKPPKKSMHPFSGSSIENLFTGLRCFLSRWLSFGNNPPHDEMEIRMALSPDDRELRHCWVVGALCLRADERQQRDYKRRRFQWFNCPETFQSGRNTGRA